MRRQINKIRNSIRTWLRQRPYHKVAKAVMRQKCGLDRNEHHVLCIGNSITIHPPCKAVQWSFNHGMAASCPENDYCHVLEQRLRQLNISSTVTPINIAVWEENFSLDLDELLHSICRGKDIIIIRIGENVKDVQNFECALSHLITYVRQYTGTIILTGQFWPNELKEKAVVVNAQKYNLPYVPLDWIWELYRDECTPSNGESPFVCEHPNDYGMKLIADAIYNVL